jgi:hypothetical protein
LLFGVRPRDPWTFGAAVLVLAAVALAARRAAAIDVGIALRAE